MQFSILLVAAAATFVSAQINYGVMCTDDNFSGSCVVVSAAGDFECVTFDGPLAPFNDAVSAILVFPGEECIFFTDFGCAGVEDVFTAGVYPITPLPENDQYSSYLCFAH